MEKSRKVLIASLVLIGLLVGLVVVWFVASQPPPYQKVPFSSSDFKDYPAELVVNRSKGQFNDHHIAIASAKGDKEEYWDVFVGLKLTGFAYYPLGKIMNYTTPEGIVVWRLDALAMLTYKGLKIEELSLSCEFNESSGEEVLPFFGDPVAYNLELVNKTKGYISPSESFITWKGIGYCTGGLFAGFFTDSAPIQFYSYENSTPHDFVLTLKLVYSYNPFTKQEISTSLQIVIMD